jgi:hypothetical protein
VTGAVLTPVYVPVPDTAQVYVFPDSEHEGVVGAVVETVPYVTAQEGDATKSTLSAEIAPLIENFTKAQKSGDVSLKDQAGQALTMAALRLNAEGTLTPADFAALSAARQQ